MACRFWGVLASVMDAPSCCTRPGAESAPAAFGVAIGGDACAGPEAEGDCAAGLSLRPALSRALAGVLTVGPRESMTGVDPCDPAIRNAATSAAATVAT